MAEATANTEYSKLTTELHLNIPCRGVAAILLFRAGQADSQECTRNICSYTETLATLDGNPASPLFAQESIWKAIKTLLLKYFSDRLRRITCQIRHIILEKNRCAVLSL